MLRSSAGLISLALLCGLASAQSAPTPPPPAPASHSLPAETTVVPSTSNAAAAPAAAPSKFLAADVHFTPPYRVPFYYGATIRGDRYIIRQATLDHLIATAYNLDQAGFVGGGPTWIGPTRYDIIAKVPPGTTAAQARPMLQNLLAERFKLVIHRGDVPVPAYLLAASSKLNLKASTSSDEGSCKNQFTPPSGPGSIPSIELECRGATMAMLASTLVNIRGGEYLSYGVAVLDTTGLKGAYDFDLKFTPAFFLPHSNGAGVSLFQALQQLGLTLALKSAPRPGIVIDSVNQEPTPNAPDLDKIMPPLPPLQFEVATIRPAQPGEKGMFKVTADELNIQGVPLKMLITLAWDLNARDDNTLVAPKWIESDRIDIHGKVGGSEMGTYSTARAQQVNFNDFRQMLRSLLIDRFELKYHMENRPVDGYSLVVVDASKMTKADPSVQTECADHPGPDGIDPRLSNIMINKVYSCQNTTMDLFAEHLQSVDPSYFFYPARNDTGLKGGWNFTISWSSSELTQGPGMGPGLASAAGDAPTAGDPNGAVSFFDAIRKQLGLKLVKVKLPEPVLVIDHIDEQPTEN